MHTFRPAVQSLAVLASVFLSGEAAAFNPPVDQAGPLIVRLEAPDTVAQTDVPIPVRVVIENAADQTVKGEVRLGVIDEWRAGGPQAFQVGAKGSAALDFEVIAGQGIENALYPIHAYAEFEWKGTRHEAHPIHILRTDIAAAADEDASTWAPVPVQTDSALALWQMRASRIMCQVFGKEPRLLSSAGTVHDAATGVHVRMGESIDRGAVRPAIAMHPPWRGGNAGTVWVAYLLALPQEGPIRLTFANAIRDHMPDEPASDGATFRVRVAEPGETGLGEELWSTHTDAKAWRDGQVDLSAYAGQTIVLQLATHPGPAKDTTCDQAYWAAPKLVAGEPKPVKHAEGRVVLTGETRLDGAAYPVRVTSGSRGLLDARVEVGELVFEGFRVRALGAQVDDPSSPARLVEVAEEPAAKGCRFRHRFRDAPGAFDVLVHMWVQGAALQCRFELANAPAAAPWFAPRLEEVVAGAWNRQLERVYLGDGNVIDRPSDFILSADGHQCSTAFAGLEFEDESAVVTAVNVPPTAFQVAHEQRQYAFKTAHDQTVTFIPARGAWQGAKAWREIDTRQASGGIGQLAGRFVFDLWGGRYVASAAALERSFRYGLTDAVVVWHNWQRWGYDYRLPDIYPPNPQLGSTRDFIGLCRTCKDHGVIFAPHDNYIDFYPDAEGYSYNHIAFTEARQPQPAWLNQGRGAQSYRWRVDHIAPFLERNVALIKENIAPTGYFIDVWSSAMPHDYWTRDGAFYSRTDTQRAWGGFFASIREELGGAPMISEAGHDQLIGWLDGAQANHLRVDADPPGPTWFVWRIGCADSERIPWLDMAYHDRFIKHGAGYSSRYAGGLDSALHGIYSDDYVCTEVLTGHPAMVPSPFGRDVVRKYWLTHEAMRALALRRIDGVTFADGDIHRQHVRWGNGAEVWVNRGASDWTVEGHTLPRYGFYLRAGTVEAAIERKDGVLCEWARSRDRLYVNPRTVWKGPVPVSVALAEVRAVDADSAGLVLDWQAARPLEGDYRVFVHVVDDKGTILFQADHDPDLPSSRWQGTVRTVGRLLLPRGPLAPEYEVRAGLYNPDSLQRLNLLGLNDGEGRIRLARIQFQRKEGALSIETTPITGDAPSILSRVNVEKKPLRFGAVTADGACRMDVSDGCLRIVPLPDGEPFTLCIDWTGLPWQLAVPATWTAVGETGNQLLSGPLETEGDSVVVHCKTDVFAYHLTAAE